MRVDLSRAALIVSPHLDDAMFSAFALLRRAAPVTVVTVFTGVPDPPVAGWWDRTCGFPDAGKASETRRAEDQAAFEGLEVERSYLSLLDAQYVSGARGASDGAAIANVISGWLVRNPGGTVALPAACGRPPARPLRRLVDRRRRARAPAVHPDHVFVRDNGLRAAQLGTAGIFLYEEFPYSLLRRTPRSLLGPELHARWSAQSLELEFERDAKLARAGAYATQIARLDGDLRQLLPGHERYWRLQLRSS